MECLKSGGAEIISLTAGTMHIVYDQIARRILEELEAGLVKESTLKEFTSVINRMKTEDGIEAVILGCTELPLLLNQDNCPVCCLDSVEIHLNKLVELTMEE